MVFCVRDNSLQVSSFRNTIRLVSNVPYKACGNKAILICNAQKKGKQYEIKPPIHVAIKQYLSATPKRKASSMKSSHQSMWQMKAILNCNAQKKGKQCEIKPPIHVAIKQYLTATPKRKASSVKSSHQFMWQ